ncbi:hypothetical protein [Nocardiopsis trehalosi]|jgi:hypothetical protein|uniref:hypothetical protein n=1 Tax=Nocardiopsis trehalosi TaxID=109329 RepID=UPI00082E49A2|nr:hypothetical protein [Nocardiopsis trehalosi]
MGDTYDPLLAVYDEACAATCRYCPCPLPPETVRCRLCGRLQDVPDDDTGDDTGDGSRDRD